MACAKGCCITLTKVFLVVLNVIFLIIGAALLGAGVWMKVDPSAVTYMRILSTSPSGPVLNIMAWVLIGVGAFLFVISFLGCCGTCCESHMMLYFYVVLLILVMAAEITGAVLAYIYRTEVKKYLNKTLKEQVKLQYNRQIPAYPNNTDALTAAWDSMQVNLDCCGASGPSDYYKSKWYNETARPRSAQEGKEFSVPETCCVTADGDDIFHRGLKDMQLRLCQSHAGARVAYNGQNNPGSGETLALHTTGCTDAVMKWVSDRTLILVGVAAGILGLQILIFILSCCLLQHVRRKLEDYDF